MIQGTTLRIHPDPPGDHQMFHCTSHLFCTFFFPKALCLKVMSEKGQAMASCHFSNSSVLKKSQTPKEEACEAQCCCKSISCAFRVSKHCSFWQKTSPRVLSTLSVFTQGAASSLGITSWTLIAARSLSYSCTAVERSV